MTKPKKRHRLPYWIRSQEFRLLNNSEKDFLGWLYSFGPDTCWLWNWRLQGKFHRCRRTIQYWLAKLKELGFIWIEKPFGPERKIHTRLIPTPEHWVKLIGTLTLARHTAKHKRPRGRRRGFPAPLHEHSSGTTIAEARRSIIAELVHRGESIDIAEKVADQVIAKSREKANKKKV
ncbi:hypothetical protein ES703_23625 [subsurface metagenome]